MFNSWEIFVHELKRAFTSSFHEELAFKKLELYAQGEHQSIRNFFNEVLKLCKEADSTMSEATKLKNLVNKAKPTIQFEVRKKKPTTTTEFLEYAKDVEELFQLSSIPVDNNTNNNFTPSKDQQVTSLIDLPISDHKYSNNSSSSTFPSGYSRNFPNNNYNNTFTNRNNRYNPQYSTFTPSSFRSPQPSRNPPRITTQPFVPNRNNTSYNTNNNGRFKPPTNQVYPSTTNSSRPRTANSIFPVEPSSGLELEQESLPSIPCFQCNQFGHEASSCQNF